MAKRHLRTTDEVIDALGGTSAVARLLRRRPQVVHNWRLSMRGKFPPETFLVLKDALRQEGEGRSPKVDFEASPSLWGIEEPSHRGAAA